MVLAPHNITFQIKGHSTDIVKTFLTILLANNNLSNMQLSVATALVTRYSKYVNDGVVEPYASTLLFSTEVRKEIVQELGTTSAHVNNTIKPLIDKNVLMKTEGKYFLNPNLIPTSSITFKFSIDDTEPRPSGEGGSKEVKSTKKSSPGNTNKSTQPSSQSNSDKGT